MKLFSILSMAMVLIFACAVEAQMSVPPKGKTKPVAKRPMPVPSPTPLPSTPVAPAPPSLTDRHWYGSVLYSTANQLKYKGNLNLFGSPAAYTATEDSAAAFGFSGGYISRKAFGFGYSGEISYELPRTSQGVNGTASGLAIHGTYDKAPSNIVLAMALNGNFSIGERVYIFGGLNYPATSGESGSLSGLPGYQLGVGFQFTDRVSSDLSYRVIRLKGSIDSPPLNLQVDEATFPGFILAVHYHF